MNRRAGLVTMKGRPVVLVGREIRVGDKAPDFEAVDADMNPFKLSSLKGKPVLILSVPSLDTPVCDVETRKFNEEAVKLAGVSVLAISMDLPFAQKRWCAAAGIAGVKTLSDYRNADFGKKYGVLIEDLRLLARAVFVVDGGGIVRHVEIVKEIASEPDYAAALKAAAECR